MPVFLGQVEMSEDVEESGGSGLGEQAIVLGIERPRPFAFEAPRR